MNDLGNLARHVKARREALGLSQMDIWKRLKGPSSTKIGQIEEGRPPAPSPATRAKLERALRWTAGSVDRILEGGEPTIETSSDPWEATAADIPRDPLEELFNRWDAAYTEMVRLEAQYAQARGIPRLDAFDELHEVWRMWHDGLDGRPWTPPWTASDQGFIETWGEDATPWLRSWWAERGVTGEPWVFPDEPHRLAFAADEDETDIEDEQGHDDNP